MDYRHSAIDTLTDFAVQHEEYSFGEILYSVLWYTIKKDDTTNIDIPTEELLKLKDIPDDVWYEIIEKSKKYEQKEGTEESDS